MHLACINENRSEHERTHRLSQHSVLWIVRCGWWKHASDIYYYILKHLYTQSAAANTTLVPPPLRGVDLQSVYSTFSLDKHPIKSRFRTRTLKTNNCGLWKISQFTHRYADTVMYINPHCILCVRLVRKCIVLFSSQAYWHRSDVLIIGFVGV